MTVPADAAGELKDQMEFMIHSSTEYHRREIQSLGWETTLCNTLADDRGPCRSLTAIDAPYGQLLFSFLSRFFPLDKLEHVMEVGGGYGWLMRDFLRRRPFPKVTMIDISPYLLAKQRAALEGFPVEIVFRTEDFLETTIEVIREAELIILNENIGDYPTLTGLTEELFSDRELDVSPVIDTARRFFNRYELPLPPNNPFNLNIGAMSALERICQAGVPYIFLSEHSCEATVPPTLRKLISVPSPGDPECILLKGHEEFTIRFSYLEAIGRRLGYRVLRGPVADIVPFVLTPRLRAILKAPSPWRDEDEAVRFFLEDLYKYEYLVMCRDNPSSGKRPAAECRRCGKCCLADFIAYVKEDDLQRWRQENRRDILGIIASEHAVWAGDHLVSGDDGHYLRGCPFLAWEGDHTTCAIYETRPAVCRNFVPGSAAICPLWQG